MDLLKQYDFDALPYIDKEYDNPIVQDAVHQLISSEMRAFIPGSYLAYLPYPKLSFVNTSTFQTEVGRIQNGTSPKLDMSRYDLEKPQGVLEKDIQAWRKSISNVKRSYEYQSNRLMNLELADESSATVWLHYNAVLEQIETNINTQTSTLKRKIDEINLDRKTSQELVRDELLTSLRCRDEAVYKSWQIKSYCDQLLKEIDGIESEIKNISAANHVER
mmetsp:Transcript_32679/g.33325  ORF Transcript_32679/g.33325 Transcript_32679/m.33325 type:complete len:219 (+) Transcript_32679:152-808(+)